MSKLEPAKRRVGRPSIYNDAMADELCRRIAEGRSLRQVCMDDDMPDSRVVYLWMHSNPDFYAKRARAEELRADLLADQMADLENRTLNGTVDAAAARAVLSSMQWRASKMAPKRYGDKLELHGPNGGPLQVEKIEWVIVDPK